MMRTVPAVALLLVGLCQMIGDLFGWASLKGLAAVSGASPAPKVFSSVKGLETFSTGFFIEWDDLGGKVHSIQLTPELYSRMAGPYNRRNVYGAVLAYGPVLISDDRARAMFHSVASRALDGDAPLLAELGIRTPGRAGPVRIRLLPRSGAEVGALPLLLEGPWDRPAR